MQIKEITNQLGVSRKAILYYEQEGLIKANRLENDYRDYNLDEVNKIKQIHQFRLLNVPVSIIKQYLTSGNNNIIINYCEDKRKELYAEQNNIKELQAIVNNNEELTPISALQYLEASVPGFFGKYISNNFKYYFEKDNVSYVGNEMLLADVIKFIDSKDWSILKGEIDEIDFEIPQSFHDNQYKLIANLEKLSKVNLEENSIENEQARRLQVKLIDLEYYSVFIPLIKKLSPSYNLYVYKIEQIGKALETDSNDET